MTKKLPSMEPVLPGLCCLPTEIDMAENSLNAVYSKHSWYQKPTNNLQISTLHDKKASQHGTRPARSLLLTNRNRYCREQLECRLQ